MSSMKQLIILIIPLLLVLSCAKKKEQAQQLEKEIVGESLGEVEEQIDSIETDSVVIEEIETKVSMPPRPKGAGFTVQIAGCEDESYAESLVELYRKRGYEPFISHEIIDGVNYHRVRIGMFYTLKEANLLKQELFDKYSVDSWIDKVR